MKRTSFILLFAFIIFNSCEDPIDYGYGQYYVEIVTALGDEIFELDNGQKLINTNASYPTAFEAGQRILLRFSYVEGCKDKIKIRFAGRLIQGVLDTVEQEKILAHPNDPVKLESLWIGNHFLNILFYIEHKSEPHSVVLWVDKLKVDKNKIDIYFLHNINNDEKGVFTFMSTSFDLSSVLGQPQGEKTIKIHLNTTNYGNKIYEFNY